MPKNGSIDSSDIYNQRDALRVYVCFSEKMRNHNEHIDYLSNTTECHTSLWKFVSYFSLQFSKFLHQ